jgi:hypothetical protein
LFQIPKLPLPAQRVDWNHAARAATAFWQMAAADERISAGFRAICADNAAVLRKLVSG